MHAVHVATRPISAWHAISCSAIMTPFSGRLQAVETAYHFMFVNSGQICVAPSRLFVHEGIYDTFLERVVARARQR